MFDLGWSLCVDVVEEIVVGFCCVVCCIGVVGVVCVGVLGCVDG